VFSPIQEEGDVSANRGSEVEWGSAIGVRDPERVEVDEVRRLRRRSVEGECCLWGCDDEETNLEEPPRI
jgi:hypothetical protein